MNLPRPSLNVTALEDRCVATTLVVAPVWTPLPTLSEVPAKVAHLPTTDVDAGNARTGEPRMLGLRPNHNETFVRRKVRR